jgi:signal transduction histidine kinase
MTDTYVTIKVRDDGPGIAPAIAETVFEPGVTTTGDGSGLGLALARRVARSAGGEVVLEQPSAGPGVVFSVRLPVSTDPASP